MIQKYLTRMGLLAGTALLCATGALNAAALYSEKIEIPFQFQVQSKALPSGVYRVEQPFGSAFATLVNVNTGARVHVLRADGPRKAGRAILVFESSGSGYKLKSLS